MVVRVVIAALAVGGCSFEGSAPSAPDAQPATDAMSSSDGSAPLGLWSNLVELDLGVGPATPYDDPVLLDDMTIIFAGPVVGQPQDLFQASPDGQGGYNTPVALGVLNTPDLESTVWVSGDGLSIMFARGNIDGDPTDVDIFVASRMATNQAFSTPTSLPEEPALLINGPDQDALGALTADGMTLYFTSNRDGDFDVFKATRPAASGPFDNVEKLPISTTSLDEVSPKLSPDEQTLYLSARTAGDMNAPFDILEAKRGSGGDFENPTVLADVDVLESNEDFAVHSSNRTAVFASNRSGNQRIYRVTR